MIFLVVIMLVFVFAGCGGGGTDAADQGGQTHEESAGESPQENKGGEGTAGEIIEPEQVENGITPEDIYRFTKDNFEETLEQAEGIGDDAFIDTLGFHMLYRGYYVVILLGNSDDPSNIERLKTAGQKAAANLDALLN